MRSLDSNDFGGGPNRSTRWTKSQCDPKLLAEIRTSLHSYAGRCGIGTCTYGQPLSTFINEESNVRQIAYALDADRRHFGVAPETYLMSEHAMHSQLPQILNGFASKAPSCGRTT